MKSKSFVLFVCILYIQISEERLLKASSIVATKMNSSEIDNYILMFIIYAVKKPLLGSGVSLNVIKKNSNGHL